MSKLGMTKIEVKQIVEKNICIRHDRKVAINVMKILISEHGIKMKSQYSKMDK